MRRLELLNAQLRLLQGAIAQLHERFDLLIAEISELKCDHAIDCELTADIAPESDTLEPGKSADDPEDHPAHATARQAASLTDRLAGLESPEIKSPDALTAAPADTHDPAFASAAEQVDPDAILSPLDRPSSSESHCMQPSVDYQVAVAAMRPIPPWDIVASGMKRNKRIRHGRSCARGTTIAVALMVAAACALAAMSPFSVATQPAVADPMPMPMPMLDRF
jgi:hypothetical protein